MDWLRPALAALAIGSFVVFPGAAKDLGTMGTIFPIEEPDLAQTLMNRLSQMEVDGSLDALREEMGDTARDYVRRPRPAGHFETIEDTRSRILDLSILVTEDIRTNDGRLIAAAGTRVNPLDYSRFNRVIFYVDGDDAAQVAWATAQGDVFTTLVVMFRGDPIGVSQSHNRRIWFDQDGQMARRFDVQAVPARIARTGAFMSITEFGRHAWDPEYD